jgi:hypothetical protein
MDTFMTEVSNVMRNWPEARMRSTGERPLVVPTAPTVLPPELVPASEVNRSPAASPRTVGV